MEINEKHALEVANIVIDAVNEKNAKEVGRITDILRAGGKTHKESWRFFSNITGIIMAEYDELLYEAEAN